MGGQQERVKVSSVWVVILESAAGRTVRTYDAAAMESLNMDAWAWKKEYEARHPGTAVWVGLMDVEAAPPGLL